jgi:dihydroneopterin aldolase
MRQIVFLDQLEIPVSIGIHDFEKDGPQPYRVSIWLGLSGLYWCNRDGIDEAVDYDVLRDRVRKLLMSRHFQLQETVAQEVLAIAFGVDDRIENVRVVVAKTDVYPDCASVGLDYSLSRGEWARARA